MIDLLIGLFDETCVKAERFKSGKYCPEKEIIIREMNFNDTGDAYVIYRL